MNDIDIKTNLISILARLDELEEKLDLAEQITCNECENSFVEAGKRYCREHCTRKGIFRTVDAEDYCSFAK